LFLNKKDICFSKFAFETDNGLLSSLIE